MNKTIAGRDLPGPERSTVDCTMSQKFLHRGDYGRDDGLIDREIAILRLEEAGRTLLALPASGYSTKLRSGSLDIVRSALESYGWGDRRIVPAIPPAAQISRMDDALSWISFIPLDRYVLRRVVGARALVHPLTGRYLYSWRGLARILGADHKAIQRWHSLGLDMIVSGVNERRLRQNEPLQRLY